MLKEIYFVKGFFRVCYVFFLHIFWLEPEPDSEPPANFGSGSTKKMLTPVTQIKPVTVRINQ